MNVAKSSRYQLGFRKDIEGLRAVAILLVIASHAQIPGLAGGFVGVDVFFVLSGYLITGLLFHERWNTGRLNLVAFYARRLKRLLPALLFMIVAVSLLSILFFSPNQQLEQIASAQAATFWVSNLHFALSFQDYFGQLNEESLFLHTWSLGVEEQFYLVWPFVIAGLFSISAGKRNPQNVGRFNSHWLMILGVLFGLSLVLSYTYPLIGFYMMPSRAWQFALGAAVLLVTSSDGLLKSTGPEQPGIQRDSRFIWCIGWIGLLMIAGAAVYLDRSMVYPGFWALLPSIGTAFVLFAGATGCSGRLGFLLALPAMQLLGRVSYSLYLWHWPVLLFGALFDDENTAGFRIILIVLALGCACFSYLFVESPVRHREFFGGNPVKFVAMSVASMATVVLTAFVWSAGAQQSTQNSMDEHIARARTELPAIYPMGCDDWYSSAQVKMCTFGSTEAHNVAVLFGNSRVAQWFPALAQVYGSADWKLIVITKSACPLVDEPYFYERIGREFIECEEWRHSALSELNKVKPRVVFLGETQMFEREKWVQGMRRTIAAVADSADQVVFIRPNFSLPFNGPDCLLRRARLSKFAAYRSDCSVRVESEEQVEFSGWIGDAVNGYGNVRVMDLNPYVCPDNVCRAELNGKIVFRDNSHLSASFVRSLADRVGSSIEMVLN